MTVISPYRRLYDVELTPVSGARFQPTGFPDIGAARFSYPVRDNGSVSWKDALIVESAQSMANRLEAVGWDTAAQQPVPEFDGLPYVRVTAADDGRYIASSRTEAHRLASAYVKDSQIDGQDAKLLIRERLGLRDDTPLAPRDIARSIMALDPLCLVHGVFFAEKSGVWPGQPKIARALTAFIEAIGIRDAVSGGVKRDQVRHGLGEGGGTQEGYGFVPYHRVEYTAERIVAHFSVDTAQIAAYGLGEAGAGLLETIALWEIRSLLDGGLRLRTACDLAPATAVTDRSGAPLPPRDELAAALRGLIGRCAELLGDGEPIQAVWNLGKKKRGS